MSNVRRRLAAGLCAALIACTGLMVLAGTAGRRRHRLRPAAGAEREAVAKLAIIEPGAIDPP